jgi:hypothetical protein
VFVNTTLHYSFAHCGCHHNLARPGLVRVVVLWSFGYGLSKGPVLCLAFEYCGSLPHYSLNSLDSGSLQSGSGEATRLPAGLLFDLFAVTA